MNFAPEATPSLLTTMMGGRTPALSSYASFSDFVASDHELSIYRAFKVLGSRNLLYLQSSLLELEHRLKEFDKEDSESMNIDDLLTAKCWETFAAKAKERPREAERMEVIEEIRARLSEYREFPDIS